MKFLKAEGIIGTRSLGMLLNRENCLARIRPFYDADIIKVLTGSRRAGKSKVIEQIIQELKTKGVQDNDILYLNFEDLRFDDIDDYKKLNYYVLSHKGSNKQYLFFDEIQHVRSFEKAVNSFRVSFDCSIFITGSNSKMLSSEISTLLTGRIIEFTIYPFTFSEANEYVKKQNREPIEFGNYLRLGGYPLRFDIPDEKAERDYLKELFDNICRKDIFARDSKMEKTKFLKVAKYVLLNAGCDFNPEKIGNYLKTKGKEDCSVATIYSYLEKLESSFLIKPIYRYNIAGKTILKSNPKYYAIDNGMRYICSSGDSYDRGRFLENVILIELLSRDYEVYVGKTYKGEVDFVACKNGKKCFIQVALTMEQQETIDREFGAFSPIRDGAPKYVMSLDAIDMSRDGITHLNIVDFLLGKVDIHLS